LQASLPIDELLLAGAALLVAGVLTTGVAARFRVPGLLVFLVAGMVIGDDGLNLISLSDAELAQQLAVVALVVILFEGGLSSAARDLREVAAPALALATIGVLVTAGVTAAAAGPILGVDTTTALLIGAVVASTDAAAVFSVLRGLSLPARLRRLLEAESGANDPMAILLTVGLLTSWEEQVDAWDWVSFGLRQLVGGLVVGYVVGRLGGWLFERVPVSSPSLHAVLGFGMGGMAYGVGTLLGTSGFLAAYVAGVVLAAFAPAQRRGLRTFHEGLATMAQIGLFLMLGLLVFPSRLDEHALGAILVTVVLVVVARPLAVLVGVSWWTRRPAELALISWAGLRGAVPIVLATFPLTAGYPEGELIFDVVFFVVLASVLVQGLPMRRLASALGMEEDPDPVSAVAEAIPIDAPGVTVLEVEVGASSSLSGMRLAEVPPPLGSRVAVILRQGSVVVPDGSTQMAPGDRLVVFGTGATALAAALEAWAAGPAVDHHP